MLSETALPNQMEQKWCSPHDFPSDRMAGGTTIAIRFCHSQPGLEDTDSSHLISRRPARRHSPLVGFLVEDSSEKE